MRRQFDPETDVVLLRDSLKKLFRLEGKKLAPFAAELVAYWAKQKGPDGKPVRAISRTSLQDYLKSESPTVGNMGYLRGIWDYLSQHPDYSRYLPEASPEEPPPTSSLPRHDALSAGLAAYFGERPGVRHMRTVADAAKRLEGSYVMYRPDLRGPKVGLPSYSAINASFVEIFFEGQSLRVRETQDFGITKRFGWVDQVNEGVVFTYGRYVIALMDVTDGISFKCLVIKEFSQFVGDSRVSTFSGLILVASEVESFPSVKFFCRRLEGAGSFGIFAPEEVDDEIAKVCLATPTFPGFKLIS